MKRFVTAIIVLLFTVIFAATIPSACGNENTKIKITDTMFTDYRIDLAETVTLGIAQKDESLKQDKNYMVGINNDDTLRDIVFLSDKNAEITQEQIDGQIVKLDVAKNLTFMMFAKGTAQSQADTNHLYYSCQADQQSFVIDNVTGKIYSLAEFCGNRLMAVQEDYITLTHQYDSTESKDKDFYALKIQDDFRIFTNLSPYWPNYIYNDVFCDKFDNYYVGVDTGQPKINNVFYYDNRQDTHTRYFKGSGDYSYKVFLADFSFNFRECSIKRMGAYFAEMDLEPTITTKINLDADTNILVSGEKMLYVYGTNLAFGSYDGGYYVQNGEQYLSASQTAFLGTELFFVGDGIGRENKLYHYDWITKTETFVMDNVSKLTEEGFNLYAYTGGATGAKKYQITFAYGQFGYTPALEKTYSRTMLTIQPLD